MSEQSTLLDVSGLSKSFPGVKALSGLDFSVRSGEVVAIVGQNGCGKSTLVKCLAGLYDPDPGSRIDVAGDEGSFVDLRQSTGMLHFIHQDLALVNQLNSIENFSMGTPLGPSSFRPALRTAERQHAQQAVDRFGASFDVSASVSELTAAERTIVAIARALDGWDSPRKLLVLDEPTAALHGEEVEKLFTAVRTMAASGAGVIFISHRLDEVISLADRIVALRDGRKVADMTRGCFVKEDLVHAIAGKTVATNVTRSTAGSGKPVLTVHGLRTERLSEPNFTLRAGEILGITGLLGSGSEQLASTIFGSIRREEGTVQLNGRTIAPNSPKAAITAGIAFAPSDRRGEGAVMTLSVKENLTLPWLRPLRGFLGHTRLGREIAETHRWMELLDVRPRDPEKTLGLLSGGNQQKIVLAKWLRMSPKVFLLDEPSQGVDVEAKAAIHAKLRDIAEHGAGVMVSSTDTDELAAICDRVLVLVDGQIVAELSGNDLTEAHLLLAAQGTVREPSPTTLSAGKGA